MENLLFFNIKTVSPQYGGIKAWLNVQTVEQTSLNPGNRGRWLVAQTRKGNECNSKSDYSTAPNARNPSA